jgi:hypothetical protein
MLDNNSTRRSSTSLMPVVRRQTDPDATASSPTSMRLGDAVRDMAKEDGPSSSNHPDGPDEQEVPPQSDEMLEKVPMLGLPAPNDQAGRWDSWLGLLGIRTPRILWVRTIKSFVLVGKVRVCVCLVYSCGGD